MFIHRMLHRSIWLGGLLVEDEMRSQLKNLSFCLAAVIFCANGTSESLSNIMPPPLEADPFENLLTVDSFPQFRQTATNQLKYQTDFGQFFHDTAIQFQTAYRRTPLELENALYCAAAEMRAYQTDVVDANKAKQRGRNILFPVFSTFVTQPSHSADNLRLRHRLSPRIYAAYTYFVARLENELGEDNEVLSVVRADCLVLFPNPEYQRFRIPEPSN